MVELLLKDPRVDPSSNNNYAIRKASKNGCVKMVGLLLQDSRVDPPSDTIEVASNHGHIEIVRLLLLDEYIDGLYPSIY